MEELLCSIEIVKENNEYVAKFQSDLGSGRECRSADLENLLGMLFEDILEEFD